MDNSTKIRIALANSIAESLWLKGLITEEELAKIKALNTKQLGGEVIEETDAVDGLKPTPKIEQTPVAKIPKVENARRSVRQTPVVEQKTISEKAINLGELENDLLKLNSQLERGIIREGEYELLRKTIIAKYSK